MKLGINPETKVLTVDNEPFQFDSIDLLESPYWVVNLTDGGVLILDFKGGSQDGGR